MQWVAESGLHEGERDVLKEEIRDVNEGDMTLIDALDSTEKLIAIRGDRWWPQTSRQDGDEICQVLA